MPDANPPHTEDNPEVNAPEASSAARDALHFPKASHHSLTVRRTARYSLLGDPDAAHHVFVLHGYGQQASDFLRPFAAIEQQDRCIIAPEALSRFYTDDLGEHEKVGASWMTREAREEEITDYVAYLDTLAGHLADEASPGASPGASPRRTVLGFSQGAATASRWALLGDTPVDRLVFWAGTPAHDLDLQVHGDALRKMEPVFVVGDDDPWITKERRMQVKHVLEQHGVPFQLRTFDGGHRLSRTTLHDLFSSA